MFELREEAKDEKYRALLVAVYDHQQETEYCCEMLDELAELADTCGADVLEKVPVRVRGRHPRFVLGSGKAEEIVARCRELNANVIIFDESLTPAQQRNWETLSDLRVMDRQEVILTIFSNRASTKEAELQIELARSEFMLPRIRNAWSHLDRQRGVLGLRGGEGEKQIEIDARLLRKRITQLKTDLECVRKQRAQQRKRRQSIPLPNAAIVGYTNAGKSSLLNRLTQADVLVEDKLFATLDPTTRRIELPNRQTLLLTDTVGFIRRLPHGLVEAFKATLEEAVLATFLIHMVDINSTSRDELMETTMEVLEEIGAGGKEVLTVFNKIDLAPPHIIRRLRHECPDAAFISAKTGEGVDDLIERVTNILDDGLHSVKLHLPLDKYDLLALLHRKAHVIEEAYEDDGIYVTADVPQNCRRDLEKYIVR